MLVLESCRVWPSLAFGFRDAFVQHDGGWGLYCRYCWCYGYGSHLVYGGSPF